MLIVLDFASSRLVCRAIHSHPLISFCRAMYSQDDLNKRNELRKAVWAHLRDPAVKNIKIEQHGRSNVVANRREKKRDQKRRERESLGYSTATARFFCPF